MVDLHANPAKLCSCSATTICLDSIKSINTVQMTPDVDRSVFEIIMFWKKSRFADKRFPFTRQGSAAIDVLDLKEFCLKRSKSENGRKTSKKRQTYRWKIIPVLWIRTGFNADPDTVLYLNADPGIQTNADQYLQATTLVLFILFWITGRVMTNSNKRKTDRSCN